MFADTTFTMKSGPMGTSMFSRVGKYTNYQYLCFNPNQGQEAPAGEGEEQAEDAQMRQQVAQEQLLAEEQYMVPNKTATTGFNGTKASEMNKTKKTNQNDEGHTHKNADEEQDVEQEKKPKGSPIVAQPGVNTAAFLSVGRDMV